MPYTCHSLFRGFVGHFVERGMFGNQRRYQYRTSNAVCFRYRCARLSTEDLGRTTSDR